MSRLNWEQEQQRFMAVAYSRTITAAKRAFYGWSPSKRPDAIAECVAKMWDSWSRLLLRGQDPQRMLSGALGRVDLGGCPPRSPIRST
jgi:hypothetical protein